MSTPATNLTDAETERLTRRGLRLAQFTVGYNVIEGIRSFTGDEEPERSWIAIGLLVASMIVMPVLAAAKKRVGEQLDDNLIFADAAETDN